MKKIIEKICERTYNNALRFDGKIPANSTDAYGKFKLGGGGWTDGFFVGMLYLAYAYTKDEKFLKCADAYQPYFEKRAENAPEWCEENNILPLDHDTGFIFKLSQVYRYKLNGDEKARALAIRAADILAARYNPKGRFIRAWDTWKWDTDPEFIEAKKGKMIIDSMMNIALLFFASEETGDPKYRDIAAAHADTIAKYIIRPDGSTFHQFDFDPCSGEPKRGVTGQGYADDSCWSRGQAWAIYGFCETYEHTKCEKYLDFSEKTAKYFISHLMPTGLPLWDFACEELPLRPYDSSAAAVALSGLISLNKYRKNALYEGAIARLYSGLIKHCSALDIDGWESVLLHSCIGSAYRKGNEHTIVVPYVDCPIIYADYYFLEALMKITDTFKL